MQIRTTSAAIAAAVHGHSIREKRPEDDDKKEKWPEPKRVFLIYITIKRNRLTVRHREAKINQRQDVDEVEDLLYEAAKQNWEGYGEGHSFKDLKWSKRYYLTLVLDLEDWDFYWGANIGDDPLIFRKYKDDGSGPYDPNYSFYNAVKTRIRGRAAVRCMNYIKGDEHGNDLGHPGNPNDKERNYSIDINVLTPFSDTNADPIKVIIDPDGQNQGPPQFIPGE